MEATELAVLMLCICGIGTFLYGTRSPIHGLPLLQSTKSAFMGIVVAIATLLIIRSPFGRRTGAHFNPALTLTYFCLGRVHPWDAVGYITAQFAGGVAGVFVAHQIFCTNLAAFPVRYVITIPGPFGVTAALVAEFIMSYSLMYVVLFASNHRRLRELSPLLVALLTVFYYTFGSSISGYSVNPARSFSSALFACIWQGIWIYFLAPCLGMLTAAASYTRMRGKHRVYCAKVFHDQYSICPFQCAFDRVIRDGVYHMDR